MSVCLATTSLVFAQQDAQISQNMFNKFAINPAYAGATPNLNASLLHRSQWVGFKGAPTTQIMHAEMPVYALSGGIGITIVNDAIGDGFKQRQFNIAYAYRGKLSRDTYFGLGITAGLYNSAFNKKWRTPGGTNGSEDPDIPDGNASAVHPDFGFGAYVQTKNYNFGLSSTHLIEFESELDGGKNARFASSRHIYGIAEARYEMNRLWNFVPSVFFKTDQVVYQLDFAANFAYKEDFTVGVSYRDFDAVALMMSYRYEEKIRFGYAYDVTVSNLKHYSSGSHEVFVRYSYPIKMPAKSRTRYRNNRFL